MNRIKLQTIIKISNNKLLNKLFAKRGVGMKKEEKVDEVNTVQKSNDARK